MRRRETEEQGSFEVLIVLDRSFCSRERVLTITGASALAPTTYLEFYDAMLDTLNGVYTEYLEDFGP
jgi:hypothetical protein